MDRVSNINIWNMLRKDESGGEKGLEGRQARVREMPRSALAMRPAARQRSVVGPPAKVRPCLTVFAGTKVQPIARRPAT